MTVHELANRLGLKAAAGKQGMKRRIADAYCGDLLSEVMVNAARDCVWLTVQMHLNIVGVAVLRNMAAIIVTGGHSPDAETLRKADQEGIPVLLWPESSYRLAGHLYALGIGHGDQGSI